MSAVITRPISIAIITYLGGLLLLLMTPAANAAVINGSFEDGLTGWTVLSDADINQIFLGELIDGIRTTYPYAQSTIAVPDCSVVDAFPPPLFPGGGAHVLQCFTEHTYGGIKWTMPNGVTYSRVGTSYSVRQTVHAQAGEVISGWANYESGDGGGPAQASVVINGQEVWLARDTQFGLPGRFLGWQHWTYTVPQDGDFTISLDIASSGAYPSAGAFFDDITLSAVPEQAMFVVGAFPILLVGLDAARRNLKPSLRPGLHGSKTER